MADATMRKFQGETASVTANASAGGGAAAPKRTSPTFAWPPRQRGSADWKPACADDLLRLQQPCAFALRRQHCFSHSPPKVTAANGAPVTITRQNNTQAPMDRRTRTKLSRKWGNLAIRIAQFLLYPRTGGPAGRAGAGQQSTGQAGGRAGSSPIACAGVPWVYSATSSRIICRNLG